MPAQLSDFNVGFTTVFACGLAAVWFAVSLQFSSRLSMLGVRARAIAVAVITDPLFLFGLLSLGWSAGGFWNGQASRGTLSGHPLAWRDYVLPAGCLLYVPTIIFFATVWNPWQGRAQRIHHFAVSRGELWNGVRSVIAKARGRRTGDTWGVFGFHVYAVPDGFRSWMWAGPASVLLWRRYLEGMSRDEIDALVALQVTRQSRRYYVLILCPAVAGALAAVALIELLNPSLHSRLLALPFLLAEEIAILAVCSSRILLRFDLRAIRLTGNPEAFISAAAEAARLNGSALNMAHLEKLARKAGVPPDRLRALTGPRERPPEDRYPTTGDYLTTGLA